jgi:hypothetical protein
MAQPRIVPPGSTPAWTRHDNLMALGLDQQPWVGEKRSCLKGRYRCLITEWRLLKAQRPCLRERTFFSCPAFEGDPNFAACLRVFLHHSLAESLKAALRLQAPFRWPRPVPKIGMQRGNRGYLFGSCLWAISNEELVLSLDELRLVLLEKIDSERKKFERLKQRERSSVRLGG